MVYDRDAVSDFFGRLRGRFGRGGFGRGIFGDGLDQSEGVAGALWEGKVGVARSGGGGGCGWRRELWGVAGGGYRWGDKKKLRIGFGLILNLFQSG